MKIRPSPTLSPTTTIRPRCPTCHSCHQHKHGCYNRNGFHLRHKDTLPTHAHEVKVMRFRCLNPECPRCTFSDLPQNVMPYYRFYWQDILDIRQSLSTGLTPWFLAKMIWNVGCAAIRRLVRMLTSLIPWIESQHQEITNGLPTCGLERMVRIIIAKLGRNQLVYRWYRHRYPLRFFEQTHVPHNSALS
jgi:hypothetical protein